MNIPENIFLVGPMGAGKTTVGRHLARLLEKDFVDCDREIEDRTGASIPLIFELEGEDGFRRRESSALHDLAQRSGIVLATGGGAVLSRENRECLVSRGFIVYLDAPIERLFERTSRDSNRPLLQTEDRRGRLEAILAERDPLYRKVADMIFKTNHRTARHVAKDIVKCLGRL